MTHSINCGACRGTHETASDIRDCYSDMEEAAAEQCAEIYAEAGMSWVAGGGSPSDAIRYASFVASGQEWNGGIDPEPLSGKTCEHGLALELCEGPQHYPMDM